MGLVCGTSVVGWSGVQVSECGGASCVGQSMGGGRGGANGGVGVETVSPTVAPGSGLSYQSAEGLHVLVRIMQKSPVVLHFYTPDETQLADAQKQPRTSVALL